MTHALVQHADQIQTDPHLEFAQKTRALLRDSIPAIGRESAEMLTQEICSAAALYAGKCTARAIASYNGGSAPRFVERPHLLGPEPLAVAAPSEPTTEFEPMQPTAKLEAVKDKPTEPLAKDTK